MQTCVSLSENIKFWYVLKTMEYLGNKCIRSRIFSEIVKKIPIANYSMRNTNAVVVRI